MDEDEFDLLSEDKVIDVEPLATAALLLEFPLVPLCDDECKGCAQPAERTSTKVPAVASRHPTKTTCRRTPSQF